MQLAPTAGAKVQFAFPNAQKSTVQGFPSLQNRGIPEHSPSVHRSSAVQEKPSSQFTWFAASERHSPSEHRSTVHGLPSWQLTGIPAHFLRPVHRSVSVHGSSSSQSPGTGVEAQVPDAGSQNPSRQAESTEQSCGVPLQLPELHWSSTVHKFPSLQLDSFGRKVQVPVSGLHRSDVQRFPVIAEHRQGGAFTSLALCVADTGVPIVA